MDKIIYLVWNNKGGVGKTFLTFMMSVEYALKNPEHEVIVIDACPQSNVSEMILGGNGKGEENLERLRAANTTIAGYIKARYERSASSRLGTEINYFINAHSYNEHMPKNLYILPGDVDLDICSAIINHMASAPQKGAWKRSRMILDDLIDSFSKRAQSTPKKQVFFIDCNPSFANYTEMAVLASTRVIVPCTADAASIRGIRNLFKLIYGITSSDTDIADDIFLFFNDNAKESALTLPKIHRFIQNKSRLNQVEIATAFKSHVFEIQSVVDEIRTKHRDIFTPDGGGDVINVKDGNTLASIINHVGQPLSQLPPKRYTIYGRKTQANQSQITPLLNDIFDVIDTL